ncbi:hypothetical protein SAMD00079811_81770 (plasmid) [Scytonema sp. HK-05]|uniref:mannose-binding lectin n=1 Tax=Scytonema sp. HK-05 TaxID=1137095 RepID=UPI000936F3C9|nr:protease pro-enzyme activation domain-containing protein [Scytonema sp. HK-05]OKH58152.1 hypothetical protein NIES2130_15790 [Scytonema sp. HK-05]BAY50548.1 hypothetical protein SAMD00079811_81770 [Scytonema sp. HK-05]
MSTLSNSVPLTGSKLTIRPDSRQIAPVDPNERIEVSLYLRQPSPLDLSNAIGAPHQRQLLSREEYEQKHGADPEDIAKVKEFAQQHDLTVVKISVVRQLVKLAGTAAAMSAAFGVELNHYEHPEGNYRGREGEIHIPTELAPIVQAVMGLDNRPVAQPRFRLREAAASPQDLETYTPPQVAQLYNFPTNLNGSGQCIAIIELGGGYDDNAMAQYFTQLGIQPPTLVNVSVDGGQNSPGNDADSEVCLDIQVAGAVAPGAKLAVYFAPNNSQGFINAITKAIHDTDNQPSIISISWGGAEPPELTQYEQTLNQACQAAALLGVTICVASGDDGSNDRVNDGKAHVDFPASSPYVLACGGTTLQSSENAIASEVVWHNPDGGATGGGVSDLFDLPSWQAGANIPPSANPGGRVGRGVPDVAGDADPRSGFKISVNGQPQRIGGTSGVAPLWAGLIALINQRLGKPVGYLNPILYQQLAQQNLLNNITSGNNGAYQARPGWDACTGWGSPNGTQLLQALLALGQSSDDSRFQNSCTNISINGDVLSAACADKNGKSNSTQLTLMGISNENGQLVQANLNSPSTFQNSCTNISINGDVLSAQCADIKGNVHQTSITLKRISNNNGQLTYE